MRLQLGHILSTVSFFGLTHIMQAQDSLLVNAKTDPIQVDFIYSYYEQDGVNSPVTGGVGDERLKDNVYKMSVVAPLDDSWTLFMSAGIDIYTSASTDNINNEYDQYVETSASYKDSRKYGSIGVTRKLPDEAGTISVDGGFSTEWDVNSINANLSYTREFNRKNTTLNLWGSFFQDTWELIYPTEFRVAVLVSGEELLSDNIRYLYNAGIVLNQVVSPRVKVMASVEAVYIQGLLSTPFHRVYFTDSVQHDIERLPDSRLKIPAAIQVNAYLSDYLISRVKYRSYWDDFGIVGHTVDAEFPIKPFLMGYWRITPFYRFHTQSASKYFGTFASFTGEETYYTSDFDLSGFMAHKLGLGIKYSPLDGIANFGNSIQLKKAEVRSGKYYRYFQGDLNFNAFFISTAITLTIK